MGQDNVEIYEVLPIDKFNDDMKFYIKKRKYTKIAKDIENILNDLEKGVFKGDVLADLKLGNDNNTYKVRAVNSNTKEGQSNGYRLIYYVENEDKIVFLITIYHKKDDDRIPSKFEISKLIEKYCF